MAVARKRPFHLTRLSPVFVLGTCAILYTTVSLQIKTSTEHLFSSVPNRALTAFVETDNEAMAMAMTVNQITSNNRPVEETRGMGACLMFKDDNDLLYEWLAYHYTVLPLRYLVIGIDEGAQQDPEHVLKRWNEVISRNKLLSPLEYRVIHAAEFFTASSLSTSAARKESTANDAHHAFAHRQKGFIQKCTRILRNATNWNTLTYAPWTIYTDSDEFITWNTWNKDEKVQSDDNTEAPFVENRKMLLSLLAREPHMTILDFLETKRDRWVEENRNRTACYTLPRLRFGALVNHTCHDQSNASHQAMLLTTTTTTPLSTLTYFYHARKHDFAVNRFGKTIVNLADPAFVTLQGKLPRNIHRPWLELCGPGAKSMLESMLRVNHYLASWDRYSQRPDQRRNHAYWEQTAFLQGGQSCDDSTHKWIERFQEMVGTGQDFNYLLNI